MFIMIAFVWQDAFNGVYGDVFKIINLVIFATGNGYLQTVFSIIAPSKVAPENQEKLGIMLTLIINIGIVVGSIV
jgi:hypothetical protein